MKRAATGNYYWFLEWKSNGLSNEIIKPEYRLYSVYLAPCMNFDNNFKIRIKCDKNCLEQDKINLLIGTVVNFYVVYKTTLWSYDLGTELTIGRSFFGAVKQTKNADVDKCR